MKSVPHTKCYGRLLALQNVRLAVFSVFIVGQLLGCRPNGGGGESIEISPTSLPQEALKVQSEASTAAQSADEESVKIISDIKRTPPLVAPTENTITVPENLDELDAKILKSGE